MNNRTLLFLMLGLGLLVTLAGGGVLAMAIWKQGRNAAKWLPTLHAAELRHGIPNDLLARVAYQESGWRDDVIDGTTPSAAGALGLMQMLPKYFSSVRVPVPFTDADTALQVDQAAGELARLYGVFGDWQLALAGYNAGQGRVDNYLAGLATLPTETQNYVADIAADVKV